MKKGKRWLLVFAALLLMLVPHSDAVAPFKKVSIATTTASTTNTTTSTTDAPTTDEANEAKPSNNSSDGSTKNSKLTGIPQIDYIWDPNLPRELRGFNLSSYPFFSTVPPDQDIHFKCDGLHDGFYAAIEFKCQVYHHCVYGIRHDFLCANFTAFDQKTFICHFANDVDCENSQKYWSRNDALYMATTTTSTTTTTTEPPPTPRRRPVARPLRPLRRPVNRRPADDYYYDEVEYDDDYYEERPNRRRKQRPRPRKPIMDYEDEYEEKRSFSDDEKPRRPNSRDRFQAEDELEEDYDDGRRKYDRPKSRPKPAAIPAERRKPNGRKPGTIGSRPNPDERRSFSDDRPVKERKEKPKPVEDDIAETDELPPRRLSSRRRITDKRPPTAPAADIEEPASAPDQLEAADEEAAPKVKTTPKPLEEFVTPKAAPASVFARPRAPPRIPRPVPVNEKKKFQYAVQKTATTVAPTAAAPTDEEEYYEDELYDEVHPQHGHARRRIVGDAPIANRHDEEEEELPQAPAKRRGHNDASLAGRKPSRTTLRKPVTEKKPLPIDDEEYDSAGSASNERSDSRSNTRKRLYSSRNRNSYNAPSARGSDDVDFGDEDYEVQPISRPAHRLKPNARKHHKKTRPAPPPEEEEDIYEPEPEPELERPQRGRVSGVIAGRRKNLVTSTRHRPQPSEEPAVEEAKDDTIEEEEAEPPKTAPSKPSSTSTTTGGRPTSVRVVKRPFLPSRGGSPYLPRGLQPVGAALKSVHSLHTTDSTPIDMGSTISGVRLLEHGAPLLRDSGPPLVQDSQGPRTTLPPRSPLPIVPVLRAEPSPPPPPPQPPKITLDELYENDYDVTLNDALNPTLKPLPLHQSSHHNRNYQSAFAPSANAYVNSNNNNNQSPAIHHNNYQHSNAYQVVPQSQQTQTLAAQPHPIHQHQHQPQQQQQSSNYNSDSYFSSTDIRRRAIIPAAPARSSRTDYRDVGTRIAQHFYDDIEYN